MKSGIQDTNHSQAGSFPLSNTDLVLSILDNTRDSVWAVNTSCELLYANKLFIEEFRDKLGVHLEPGINMLEALPEKFRETWSSYYKRGLNNEVFSFIDEVVLEDQSVYVEVFIYPIILNSEVTGVSLFGKDISDRYEADRALQESQLLMRSCLESQNKTILLAIDKNFRYLYYNKAHKDIMKFAYKHDIELGANILDCISSEEDREVARQNYERALAGESHTNIREHGKYKVACFESFFNPIIGEEGEIVGATGLARDITERRIAEETLRASEAALQEAQQIAKVGNWELDLRSGALKWSDEIYRIFECEPEEFDASYEAFIAFIHPEDREMVDRAYQNSLEEHTPYEIEHRILTRSQSIKHVREKCRNEFDSNGSPVKSFGIVADITEQKLAEQALKESENRLSLLNSSKDKLFSIIGHDLRSPFSSILGYSNLLLDNSRKFDRSESQRIIKIIRDSAERNLELLGNLLNWAKLQSGQLHVELEKLDLSKITRKIMDLKEPLAKAKDISLHYSSVPEIEVYLAQDMFRTVMRNLVSNAIKFTPAGGKIVVSAIPKQKYVEISVADNGVGMDERTMSRLFHIGTNYSTRGTGNEKGSGFGLELCREYVEKMGGKIWVSSEEGTGSDFRFTIPYSPSP